VASVAVVPAAGRAERFGGPKLLALIDGMILLDRTLRSLVDGGVDRLVVVTAPGGDLDRSAMLRDSRTVAVVNPDPSRGMWSSIRAGLTVADGDPVLVLPADMPFVRADTVARILEACGRADAIVVPAHRGRRGHPVAIPGRLRPSLLESTAGSLKDALVAAGERVSVEVDDPGVLHDVDVPGDL
jgi:molybdenum cofactor cytidylyltransferase